MKEANRNYLVGGTFVLAMLAALILWLTVLQGITTSRDEYYIQWDNVMGLKAGTQILYEGYRFGIIESIEKQEVSEGRKNYRVNISVESGWQIPDSAIAETTASSLLAALVVNVRGGDSTTMLAPGSEIAGKPSSDLLAAAGDVVSTVSAFLEDLKPKLERITNSVTTVLNDENAEKIAALLETLNARVAAILSAQNAARIDTILDNLAVVSEDVSDMTNGLRATKEQIDSVLARVNGLMDEHSDEVGHSLVDLHASLETVSRHIDAIANNLEGATRDFSEFSGQLRDNPSVILRGRETAEDAVPGS